MTVIDLSEYRERKQRRELDRTSLLAWTFLAAFTAWAWIEIGRAAHAIWQYCFCGAGLV